ncbi:phosphoketolase [Conexibacter sp. SYSU D00693]|uniref:phosphoketolase family protein n=1 Tax=Conexibacter sp. SYSU D00693 TaxID=2812560 RepID=UPI001F119D9F|nr:phosphoketolase family protein [Conexibacter sp. SYSU D00693]
MSALAAPAAPEPDLDPAELEQLLGWWAAANFLSVAQVYLRDNVLLREPLRPEHVKPRLVGHWGTCPGLNLVLAHAQRLVRRTGQETLVVAGPGHGGPAVIASSWLDGTWSERHPDMSPDAAGLEALVRAFSAPGGVSSHAGPHVPGSISEGGELGYSLVHAFGAVFDDPDLLAVCVVGDGEAETGPLEGSWKSVRFLDPVHDGAVLPVLHLNGLKISGPTVLGQAPREEVDALLRGHGWDPRWVEGDDPRAVHAAFAAALDSAHSDIHELQAAARERGATERRAWPAIVLRTPKGWTGPHEGEPASHQVPLKAARTDARELAQLEAWLRSYRPEERFDDGGRLVAELRGLASEGDLRLGALAQADGGRRLRPLPLPDSRRHAVDVPQPGTVVEEGTRPLGRFLRDLLAATADRRDFRLTCPDETASNRLDDVFSVEGRAPHGRVMEVLSEHLCEGWLEGYLLTGRHGLFATYEAFAMVSASMLVQHAKWLDHASRLPWRAPVASLNVLLTSTCWRNDHNGFSHQGPGLVDAVLALPGGVTGVYLPPDANCLLHVAERALRSRGRVNLLVADKQPHLQLLDWEAAARHCAAGASAWAWASTCNGDDPDVVLACAGDVPTQEALAAAALLRRWCPELRLRFVNVVDLLALLPPGAHPHALGRDRFEALFGRDVETVFAFHGHPRAVHQLLHGRSRPERFHVRGFDEHGTTTTPFDMVVRNGMSRYDLAALALRHARRVPAGARELERHCREVLERHASYVVEHLEDLPEVRDWRWTP